MNNEFVDFEPSQVSSHSPPLYSQILARAAILMSQVTNAADFRDSLAIHQ